MAYKDSQKQREYQRAYRRRKRAEADLGKLTERPSVTRTRTAEASKTTTIKTTRVESGLDQVQRLEDLDLQLYDFGSVAILKARKALDTIEPEELSVLDLKRLAELGVKLRNLAAERIEQREVTEEQRIILTETVMADPEALMHSQELLRLSAAADLKTDDFGEVKGETDAHQDQENQ